ncbi:MAG: DUF748 domain-containing protein [Acidobacteriota bacterium]
MQESGPASEPQSGSESGQASGRGPGRPGGWLASQGSLLAVLHALGVVLLVAAHMVLLLWLGASVLAPHLVGRYLEREASAALDREIRLESLRVNPFTLEIAAANLTVRNRDGSELAGFARLETNIGRSTLLGRRFTVQRFLLDNPRIHLARDSAGRLDIADLLPQGKPPVSPGQGPADAAPQPRPLEILPPGLRFSLTDVRIEGGAVSFDDAVTGTRQDLKDLHFSIEALNSEQPGLHEVFMSGGRLNESSLTLAVKADLLGDAPEVEARLNLKDVVFRHYTPYLLALKRPLDLTVGEAGIWTRLRFPGRGQSAALPMLEGNARITDVGLAGGDERVAGFETLEVQGAGLNLENGAVRVERVVLDAPQVRVVRDEAGIIDLVALLEMSGEQKGRTVRSGQAPDVQVGEVVLRGGQAQLKDEGLDLALALESLSARLNNLDLKTGSFGSLHLETGGDRFSRFSLDAQGGVAPVNLTVAASMEDADLSRPLPALKRLLPRLGLAGVASWKASGTLIDSDGLVQPRLKADLQVRNLKALAEGQAEPLLAAGAVQVSGVEPDFQAHRVRVALVSLSGGGASLTRDEKGVFAALAALGGQAPRPVTVQGAAPAASSGPDWGVTLVKTHLAGFSLEYRDAMSGAHVLADLEDLGLGEFSPGLDKPLALSAKGSLNKQAPFDISGEVRLKDPSLALRITASQLPLADFARLGSGIPGDAGGILTGLYGQAGISGELKASLGKDGPAGSFSGDASLAGVSLSLPGQEAPWASLEGMSLTGATVTLAPLALKAAVLSLDKPYLSLTLDKRSRPVLPWRAGGPADSTDMAAPAVPDAVTGSAGPSGPSGPPVSPGATGSPGTSGRAGLSYALDTLVVRGGKLDFSARGFDPPLGSQLSGLDLTLSDLRPGQPSRLSVALNVGHSGRLKAEGQAGWVSDGPMMDLKATLENLELGELSQVSQQFTGFPLTRGRLGLALDYKASGKKLDLKNKIVVVGIQLGRKSSPPGGKDVPLDLAVSLLSDARGVIDLDIPVKGSFDQAKADLSDVISTAMAGAFAKILFSPLAFLNVAQGSGQTAPVAFAPGTAELSAQGQKTLASLATAIAARPRLSLEIMAYVDPAAETKALTAALAAKAQAAQAAKAPAAPVKDSDPGRNRPPARKAQAPQAQPGAPETSGQNVPAEAAPPTQADWAQLALGRQNAVREYLVTQAKLAPERIFPITGDFRSPPALQGQPGHRADVRLRY